MARRWSVTNVSDTTGYRHTTARAQGRGSTIPSTVTRRRTMVGDEVDNERQTTGGARVTVVCSPRDHYHDAVRVLTTLLEVTGPPYELV